MEMALAVFFTIESAFGLTVRIMYCDPRTDRTSQGSDHGSGRGVSGTCGLGGATTGPWLRGEGRNRLRNQKSTYFKAAGENRRFKGFFRERCTLSK